MTLTAYHVALQKIANEPLTLTEEDFAILAELNEADEQQARAALRKTQLELVEKGIAPAPRVIGDTTTLLRVMVKTIAELALRIEKLESR